MIQEWTKALAVQGSGERENAPRMKASAKEYAGVSLCSRWGAGDGGTGGLWKLPPFPHRSKMKAKAGVCEASLSSFQPQFRGVRV